MSKPKVPAAATPAEVELVSAANPMTALVDIVRALIAVAKFPDSPSPPALIARIDEALGRFEVSMASVSSPTTVEAAGSLSERVRELESFVDRLNEDLPPRLDALEKASKAAREVGKQQGDLLKGEK